MKLVAQKHIKKRKTMRSYMPVLVFYFAFVSCNRTVTREELINYINNHDNGLKKEQVIGDFSISSLYRPNDLLVARELLGKNSINDSIIQTLKENYKPYSYFLVDLSYKNQEIINLKLNSEESYSRAVSDLAFNMKEYCYIVTSGNDTIDLTDGIAPRHFGMTGSNTLLLIFKNEKYSKSKKFELVIEDPGFGFRKARFTYRLKDIKKTPKLNFAKLTN